MRNQCLLLKNKKNVATHYGTVVRNSSFSINLVTAQRMQGLKLKVHVSFSVETNFPISLQHLVCFR